MEWSALPFHAVCNSAAMLTSTVPACAVYVYSELAQYNTVLYMYCTCTCTCTVQCSVPMYTALRSDSLCPTLAVLKAAACCPAVCSVPASTFASAKTIIFGKTHIACTCTLSRPGVRLFEIQIRHCHRPRFKGGLPDNSLMFLAKNGSARCVGRDFEVVNERETCVC